ncbi:kinetochore scaffold 1 [Protopterus annectens]|uniref:kinetochore scaffold 1 n=1 Tax=Protopterus annectens TaxID=7888 RepID=UPI001CFBFAEA|nr:kinetochore scaffold 1 [Protopterus annectens]
MSNQNQKILLQIKDMEKTMSSCMQDHEDFNFSVWKIIEWEDDHALFTFLSGSIELQVFFGEPLGNAEFCDKPCKKILDVKFESLLNDETAPMAGHLVHRLIFHFIKSSGVWHQKYSSHIQLPYLLHDISMVVSRCEMLGEEIHFLSKWGGKYNILNVEVLHRELKILFSSALVTSKFEITIPLGLWYPMNPLKFTFRRLFGKISHEDVSSIVSSVPPGCHYIKRLVEKIHQNLLCRTQVVQKA